MEAVHHDEGTRSNQRTDADRRALRARRAARPRRDGRGAQGHRHPARPRRRDQAAAYRPGQRRDVPGPVPPRGAVGGLAQPPGDRLGLRHRRGVGDRRLRDRPALHRDGVRRRPHAARHPPRGPQDPPRARPRDHLRRPGGPRLQPPRRDHPPRHQARQRDAHPERRREGDGLRHRPGHVRRLLAHDPDRRRGGHRPVPLPRAGPRRDRRLPLRRLLRRLPALRAADRPAALRGRQPRRGGLPARPRARRPSVQPRPGPHRRDRHDRDEGAGQAGRGPLPERGGDAGRHRALPRRPPRAGHRARARDHRGADLQRAGDGHHDQHPPGRRRRRRQRQSDWPADLPGSAAGAADRGRRLPAAQDVRRATCGDAGARPDRDDRGASPHGHRRCGTQRRAAGVRRRLDRRARQGDQAGSQPRHLRRARSHGHDHGLDRQADDDGPLLWSARTRRRPRHRSRAPT